MTALVIVGGKVNIVDVKAFIGKLVAIGKKHGVTVQAVNADLIAGRGHIEFSANKAVEAFHDKRNLGTRHWHGDHAMIYAGVGRSSMRSN